MDSKLRPLPPLDIAADAGALLGIDGPAIQQRVDSGAQIATGYGLSIAGATVVQLAAIGKPAILIEEKEIRRARGRIISGHNLALVVAEWEIEPNPRSHFRKALGRVGGICIGVV